MFRIVERQIQKSKRGNEGLNMNAGPARSAISRGRNAGERLKGEPKTKSFFTFFILRQGGFLLFIFRIFFCRSTKLF